MIEHWCSTDLTAVLMHFAGSAVVHLFMSRLGQAKGWTNSFGTWRVGRIFEFWRWVTPVEQTFKYSEG